MGRAIEKILVDNGHTVELRIDVDNPDDITPENLRKADVAIEFTTPGTAYGNIVKCLEAGVPVVCGTTGWLDRYDEVVGLCRKLNGKMFYASNYGLGVNILFKINRALASIMNKFGEYDVTVGEVHHTQKKDAPSGTAITLAEGILDNLDRKTEWFLGTPAVMDKYEPGKLEITSQRRSVVPGIHTVTWESPLDVLTIDHNMKSRDGLAFGAVLAASFLVGNKKAGVYSMDDLLGF